MSFEVHDCAAMSVKLKTAILLYENSNGHSGTSYATIHPVDCGEDNGPPVIRAGRPADRRYESRCPPHHAGCHPQ